MHLILGSMDFGLLSSAERIGGSAGAHVASKDIEHVLAFDENLVGLTDFRGMGLFDGILFCHADETRRAMMKACDARTYALSDGAVLDIKGGIVTRI